MAEKKHMTLQVRMLGGFYVTQGTRKIILGKKSSYRYIQLLQLVWLSGEKGITKEQLMKALYEDRDISDSNNSMNNLFYKMRYHMEEAGMERGAYIVRDGAFYKADPEFPIQVDVLEFEHLMEQECRNEQEQCICYESAFKLYKGELLPASCTELWVIERSLHLKELFEKCAGWLADYYHRRMDYSGEERIYLWADKLYPYDNWRIRQIDLLVERGDYKTAHTQYNELARFYSETLGLPPSQEMIRCYERMGSEVRSSVGEIHEIRRNIWSCSQPDNEEGGAYYCSYRGFVDLCHLEMRNMERTGQSIFIMLCTLVDYEKKLLKSPEKIKQRSAALKEAIRSCLRKGDAFTQYSSSQYLILLLGTNQENCGLVFSRIRKMLKEQAGAGAELEYTVMSLAELAEQ